MNWETLLSLGDSITIGSRSYLAYPEYCADKLQIETSKDWNAINCAVAGYTVIDLVRQMDNNWTNLKNSNPDVVSLMIGTNDLKRNTTIEDFTIAYKQVLLKSRLLIKTPNIIVNTIPLLQKGVMLPYNLGMNDLAIQYNEIIISLCQEKGYHINEMNNNPDYFFDGVHLTNNGSKQWGNQLADIILKKRNG